MAANEPPEVQRSVSDVRTNWVLGMSDQGSLGPPAIGALFNPLFGWEGSPTKIDETGKTKRVALFSPLKSGGPSSGWPLGVTPGNKMKPRGTYEECDL